MVPSPLLGRGVGGSLQKAKVIEDPYVRYRDVEYRWIALTDWTYSRRFRVSADLLAHAEVLDHHP